MGMIKNINHWVLCCIFIHFWQRQVISCIFRQYCVLVIWAVFCEFRSIEGCTSLVGVLLAGNQEIVVRFYLCPFFCFKFIVLKDFLFLPPNIYAIRSVLKACASSVPSPAHTDRWIYVAQDVPFYPVHEISFFLNPVCFFFPSPGGFLLFFLLHFVRLASISKLLF